MSTEFIELLSSDPEGYGEAEKAVEKSREAIAQDVDKTLTRAARLLERKLDRRLPPGFKSSYQLHAMVTVVKLDS